MRRFHLLSHVVIGVLLIALVLPVFAQDPTPVVHTVARGDTLARIASRYGVTVAELLEANPQITNPNVIQIGDRITIPASAVPPAGATVILPTAPVTGQLTTPIPTLTTTLTPLAPGITASPTLTTTITLTPTPGLSVTQADGAYQPFEIGGVVTSFSYPEAMTRAGMTWARSDIRWNIGEPVDRARGAVEAAHSYGFKSLLTITGNPAQMAGNPGAYYAEFAAFLGEVARLNPDAIEVWSAPNTPETWLNGTISPQAYTTMLQLAYDAIKAANPNVYVISAAPMIDPRYFNRCDGSGCDYAAFLRGMANAGADAALDCVGMRYTLGAVPPAASEGDVRGNAFYYIPLINLYAETFPDSALCFTGIGYFTGEGLDEVPAAMSWAAATTLDQQAAWIADAAAMAQTSGRVRLFMIDNVDGRLFSPLNAQAGWAVVRPNQRCPVCDLLGGG